jgi:hypothetical protein
MSLSSPLTLKFGTLEIKIKMDYRVGKGGQEGGDGGDREYAEKKRRERERTLTSKWLSSLLLECQVIPLSSFHPKAVTPMWCF